MVPRMTPMPWERLHQPPAHQPDGNYRGSTGGLDDGSYDGAGDKPRQGSGGKTGDGTLDPALSQSFQALGQQPYTPNRTANPSRKNRAADMLSSPKYSSFVGLYCVNFLKYARFEQDFTKFLTNI